MSQLINLLSRILVAFSIIFITLKLYQHFPELRQLNLSTEMITISFLAVLANVFLTTLIALIWALILKKLSIVIGILQATVIIGKVQIAKYLPGNVFHYLGRMSLAKNVGIPTDKLLVSMGMETVAVLIAGFVIAISGFLIRFESMRSVLIIERIITENFFQITFLAIILIGGLLLLPSIRRWLFSQKDNLRLSKLALPVILYLIVFIIQGIVVYFLVINALLSKSVEIGWIECVWRFAVAWTLGFIVPGAPGGIGVREAVFTGLFSNELGEAHAVVLSLLLRVISIAGDILTFLMACYMHRFISNGSKKFVRM